MQLQGVLPDKFKAEVGILASSSERGDVAGVLGDAGFPSERSAVERGGQSARMGILFRRLDDIQSVGDA